MNYQFDECLEHDIWDSFVDNSLQRNIFCNSRFLNARYNNFKLYFVKNNSNIMLGCILILDKDGKTCITPFMYQGILFSQYIESIKLHKKVQQILELTQYLLIELESLYGSIFLSLHHSLKDLRGFQWHNYHNQNGLQPKLNLNYTGVLDLVKIGSFDQVLLNARTDRRQAYNKCVKNGFTVEESSDINILNLLHNKTFERQGKSRSEGEVLLATTLAEKSISKGFGRLLICKDDKGSPASASLFLFDDKTGYYLVGANDPEYRKYGAGTFVIFEQIRKCLEDGLSQVDFIGINSPNRGDFKTSFGAIPVKYFSFSLFDKSQ